jgi:hypothetical protein
VNEVSGLQSGLYLATMRWRAEYASASMRTPLSFSAKWAAVVRITKIVAPHLSLGDAFSRSSGVCGELPPLSCGVIYGAAAIVVNESDSALGQVLLLGGWGQDSRMTSYFSATGGSGHRRMHTAG